MNRTRFNSTTILCWAIGFLGVASALAVESKKVEELSYPIGNDGNISVTINEGSIVVEGWDEERVLVRMTKRAWGRDGREADRILDEIEVDIEEANDRLVIREIPFRREKSFNFFDLFEEDFWNDRRRSPVVDLEIWVPKRSHLKLNTDEGQVSIQGTEGSMSIRMDEGDVGLERFVSDQLDIEVDEGNVELRDGRQETAGRWRLDTDEGNIYLKNIVADEVDCVTDEGEIVLEEVEIREIWMSSDEGNLFAEIEPLPGGSYKLETDEGDIEIILPRDSQLSLQLKAYEGSIESDFNLRIRKVDDGEVLEDTIGRNGTLLRATTEEGRILLRHR